ncbi:MAG TPA: type I restriction endonuclease subunit R [Pyrinomonadaceae bacterium]|nr:type I restriction endonuclease subunit R [Pyrinomonadaceae bacterium]
MKPITENHIEQYAIEELESLGYKYVFGGDIAPGGDSAERDSFDQIVLTDRLRRQVAIINPDIPESAREQAVQKVLRIFSPVLLTNNEDFHQFLIEKVRVPYQKDGFERSHELALIDFDNISNNEFLVVNQYTITENNQNKRPDILLFMNGIPLVVIELKNPTDENATILSAFKQIETYKEIIPSLFTYNAICVISDGHDAKAGSLSAGLSRFMTWKSSDGEKEASKFKPQLETLINGMLNKETLLDLVRNFIVFEKTKKEDAKTGITQIETVKKLAAYHQYYAVNKAITSTLEAASEDGDRKGGVVWHTQGSGKSLSMVFYTGKLVLRLNNPTVVVITDRNDLDEQLFGTFASAKQLLRQEPVQATSREHLKELLKVASGGIVFTTIQKFLPTDGGNIYDELSDRKNIVVIADEAHRTQYGFEAEVRDVVDAKSKEVLGQRIAYGFAKYLRDALPHATYIGFTGTPIEKEDVNTPQVFGHYVDKYDIQNAVDDGATVKIYYESRLAKVNLTDEGRQMLKQLDKELDDNAAVTDKQKAKAKWTQVEAVVGNSQRIKNLANDIVKHFEARQEVFEGKAMVVAMSRRIAVELYDQIVALRPDWHDKDKAKGKIKVIMTATSADGPELSRHHTNKQDRRGLADRFKDETDPLAIVIVIDMWLTGFDAPCLHTLYVDKLMRGHTLMQAIARVNRVFKDKPGGLVVDYLGLAGDLKKALSFYGNAGGKGDPTEDIEGAVHVLMEKVEVVEQMFAEVSRSRDDIKLESAEAYDENGFDFKRFFIADSRTKMEVILQAEEHLLGIEDGKNRFIREVSLLGQAFALTMPHPKAVEVTEKVAFFQAVKARLAKFDGGTGGGKTDGEIETAIRRIVDAAVKSDKVVDIFDAVGMDKPNISILSEEFLLEVKGMKHKNLGIELLKKILNDEISVRMKKNLVKSKAMLELLETAIKKYQNNLLSTAQIIEELLKIAREIRESDLQGERLGLSDDEVAFYNALEVNESAVQVLGDDTLRDIAREIADKVKANATIDWTIRQSARDKIMVLVRRTLTKHGYPPDKQQKAVDTILKQAELLADQCVQ